MPLTTESITNTPSSQLLVLRPANISDDKPDRTTLLQSQQSYHDDDIDDGDDNNRSLSSSSSVIQVSSSEQQHTRTKTSFYLTMITLILLGLLSIIHPFFTNTNDLPDDHRYLSDQTDDTSSPDDDDDCAAILSLPKSSQCIYAQTCQNGDGIPFFPSLYCHSLDPRLLFALLSPFIGLWLVILFRILGSTAEDFFSPSLEMFSLNLGLPPRFAGVSLLALGNGAADVSATVSAITSDPNKGYLLSLGALTGAAMFVSTVVAGVVILSANGISCRGALVRDVVFFMVTVVVVFSQLSRGTMSHGTILSFVGLYMSFVLVVLLADVYHRSMVIPRQKRLRERRERERERLRQLEEERVAREVVGGCVDEISAQAALEEEESENETVEQHVTMDRVMMALSNYREEEDSERDGGWEVNEDEMVILRGKHGMLHHKPNPTLSLPDEPINQSFHGDFYTSNTPYSAMLDGSAAMDEICGDYDGQAPPGADSWRRAWVDGRQEFEMHMVNSWSEVYYDDDVNFLSRVLGVCEFPFTILRKLTIPIPSDGYYCRPIVALSVFFSSIWIGIYALSYDVNLFLSPYGLVLFIVTTAVALMVARYAPGGDGPMRVMFSAPIALYGFIIAATWIDTIANQLVSLLGFLGIMLHIPNSVLGITILAWGNSIADLSANVAMARKGLANMAITACFAGPIFNILIGLGLGFGILNAKMGVSSTEVTAPVDVKVGFLFLFLNCIMVLFSGLVLNSGSIYRGHGYLALSLYATYIVISLLLVFL